MTPYEPVGWDKAKQSPAFRLLPALAVLAGVVAIGILGFSPKAACACTPTEVPIPPSPIVGVVIAVDSAGLGQVRTFALRLPDASTLTLTLGTLENATEFSPSHLVEHMASSEPIRAFYRREDGVPTVYRLEDAPG